MPPPSLEPDPVFDRIARIARIARALFQVPIAAVTMAPPAESLAAQVIQSDQPLVITDAAADPRFAAHPMVTGEPHLRFYAGQPLHAADGARAGVLELADRVPRSMDPAHLAMLSDVAALAERELGGGADAQVRALSEELDHLRRVKGDLVSIVGHEFRTALTGIQGFSEMMKEGSFSPAEMREFAVDIHKDALRLNQMINDVLDLDRIESGRVELELGSVDLNALVAAQVEKTRGLAPMNQVTGELDQALPPVYADAAKLDQVLENFLSNALRYSPRGGTITVRTSMFGGMARITVADEGPGIAPEQHEAIFERHGLAPTVKTRKVAGTGLGLPIVRQIAQLHGGRAWVESSPGFGATFHFTLPIGGPAGRLEGE